MITVKVGKVPGQVREVALNDCATVSQALAAAGEAVTSGFTITVDGRPADNHTVLGEGSKVLLTKNIKGNA